MSTSDIQARHTYLNSLLVQWAYNNGYKLTSGDAFRDARAHGKMCEGSGCAGYSARCSQHKERMAHDLNLFVGAEIDTDGFLVGGTYPPPTEAYRPLGIYWESLHPECRWGGRIDDGNHFETAPGFNNREDPM